MKEIPKSPERLAILEKIAQYEREGRFDEDVENDPPSRVLLPEEIEYADRRFPAECRRTAAFGAAYLYFWNLRRKKELILCKTEGLEHLAGVKGAVITCNHFHPMDSFIMQKVFDASKHPKRMYRVIREGNYTSFPGFYGFLMRNCNTLPLSSTCSVPGRSADSCPPTAPDLPPGEISSSSACWSRGKGCGDHL